MQIWDYWKCVKTVIKIWIIIQSVDSEHNKFLWTMHDGDDFIYIRRTRVVQKILYMLRVMFHKLEIIQTKSVYTHSWTHFLPHANTIELLESYCKINEVGIKRSYMRKKLNEDELRCKGNKLTWCLTLTCFRHRTATLEF